LPLIGTRGADILSRSLISAVAYRIKALIGRQSSDNRPPQNGNLLRQQKNPDRLSADDCASWIFSLPCISPFLNGLQILNISTV